MNFSLSHLGNVLGIFLMSIISLSVVHAQGLQFIDDDNGLLNRDVHNVVNTDDIQGQSFREGAYTPVVSPDGSESIGIIGVDEGEIETYEQSYDQTLQFIQNIINYVLGFLGFIALIYILYHGFLVVTAGENEEKYKDALAALKTGLIAIGGVGLSWFIVSFIFFLAGIIIPT